MDDLNRKHSIFEPLPLALGSLIIAVTAAVLSWQGRVVWCKVGDYSPWSWNIWSPHTSQHLIDPYSFTHMLHGVLAFWLVRLVFKKVPLAWCLLIAVVLESGWEILENSTWIIQRYRESTISLDYFGDSIVNSVSDILCCATGFVIAYKLRFWKSLVLFIATEIILILTIHDSLLINILMLVYPIQAIKKWQLGG